MSGRYYLVPEDYINNNHQGVNVDAGNNESSERVLDPSKKSERFLPNNRLLPPSTKHTSQQLACEPPNNKFLNKTLKEVNEEIEQLLKNSTKTSSDTFTMLQQRRLEREQLLHNLRCKPKPSIIPLSHVLCNKQSIDEAVSVKNTDPATGNLPPTTQALPAANKECDGTNEENVRRIYTDMLLDYYDEVSKGESGTGRSINDLGKGSKRTHRFDQINDLQLAAGSSSAAPSKKWRKSIPKNVVLSQKPMTSSDMYAPRRTSPIIDAKHIREAELENLMYAKELPPFDDDKSIVDVVVSEIERNDDDDDGVGPERNEDESDGSDETDDNNNNNLHQDPSQSNNPNEISVGEQNQVPNAQEDNNADVDNIELDESVVSNERAEQGGYDSVEEQGYSNAPESSNQAAGSSSGVNGRSTVPLPPEANSGIDLNVTYSQYQTVTIPSDLDIAELAGTAEFKAKHARAITDLRSRVLQVLSLPEGGYLTVRQYLEALTDPIPFDQYVQFTYPIISHGDACDSLATAEQRDVYDAAFNLMQKMVKREYLDRGYLALSTLQYLMYKNLLQPKIKLNRDPKTRASDPKIIQLTSTNYPATDIEKFLYLLIDRVSTDLQIDDSTTTSGKRNTVFYPHAVKDLRTAVNELSFVKNTINSNATFVNEITNYSSPKARKTKNSQPAQSNVVDLDLLQDIFRTSA